MLVRSFYCTDDDHAEEQIPLFPFSMEVMLQSRTMRINSSRRTKHART